MLAPQVARAYGGVSRNQLKHYSCLQACTDAFLVIFGHTDLKISLHRVVFRVEVDGDVRFCVGPQKLTVLLNFHLILMIFRFPNFSKKAQFFFSVPAANRRQRSDAGSGAPRPQPCESPM